MYSQNTQEDQRVIVAHQLSKRYRKAKSSRPALDGVSLEMRKGEILGLIGPNGAGKSTFIKLMLGVLSPTSGTIQCMGRNPQTFRTEDKKRLGLFLGGKSNLSYHLPVRDSVRYFFRLYDVPKRDWEQRCQTYAEYLDCVDILNQRVATLSLGQRLRAELLCLLVYEPDFLVLDEPTIGLDIEGKRRFRQILRTLNAEKGMSVLLTSHDLVDLERVAHRLVLIQEGQVQFDRDARAMEEERARYRLVQTDVRLPEEDTQVWLLEQQGSIFRYLMNVETLASMRSSIKEKAQSCYEEREAGLEDLLYEYYRE